MGRMLKLLPPQKNPPAAPEKQYENYRLNWIFGFLGEHMSAKRHLRLRIFSRGTHAQPVQHKYKEQNSFLGFFFCLTI